MSYGTGGGQQLPPYQQMPSAPPGSSAYQGQGQGLNNPQYPAHSQYGDFNEPKSETFNNLEFSDKSIRRGFIRKVYSILMVQLLVTVFFISIFLYNDDVKLWSAQNPGVFIGSLILTIVMLLVLACCESIRRKSPHNFICLGIFTFAEGFVLGAAASAYDQNSVLLAVSITTVVCLSLTAFSFQTKYDFTAHGGILFVCLIILVLFSFLAIFLRSTFPILNVVYACLGALLFSCYLVYDTQLMIGGNHKVSISPEEYVFAALNLYLDIVNIFLYILSIIGTRD